jgi:NDP-sugar pyrophosphorylase family protein
MIVIITTSGLGSRLGEYTNYVNKSLIKIGDKFVIDYIFDSYKNKDVEFIITLGYKGDLVKQYIDMIYNKLKIRYVYIDNFDGNDSSLGYSLLQIKKQLDINEPFIFHCNDTIIQDNIDIHRVDYNILGGYKCDDSSSYASLNISNNNITSVNEKGEILYDFIYIGWGYISSYNEFWKILENLCIQNTFGSRLSDIHVYINMISDGISFKYKEFFKYYDTGTIQSLKNANIYFPQKYNILNKFYESISFHDDIVVKGFYKNNMENILQRISYLNNNIPKIISTSKNFYSMELIHSLPLSEIYKDGLIKKLLIWAKTNLWIPTICNDFKDICKTFYFDKTITRIQSFLSKPYHTDFKIINNIDVGNIYDLISKIDIDKLCNGIPTQFHGDFILDNILMKDDQFILIDWRSDFGGNIESGDMYYDLAKLQHNIYFNHKNIQNNLFFLNAISDTSCEIDLKCNFFLIRQLSDLYEFMNENKYDLKKVNILMALIWINMATLHEYPLSNFLFNFGKYNLYLHLQ